MARAPLAFAVFPARPGAVGGAVGGAVRTTRELMRFALWLGGPAAGVRTVSSAFYMVLRTADGAGRHAGSEGAARESGEEVLTFTDCSVVPQPTAEQLADIALAAAEARRRIVGDEPRVAFPIGRAAGRGR